MPNWHLTKEDLQICIVGKLSKMVTTQMQVLKADMAAELSKRMQDLQAMGDIVAVSQELEKSKDAQAKMDEDIKSLRDKCTDLEDRS
ncbi:hypothetical protein NDU88_003388 [Pleurodeles waltl]|uniref:Uncharacterized protein n=1 Tax=Pleurodeles waltl TaxID=8319 RepID=A0AAV7UBY3_PLEWA|nr:hypothetical protein NDU88_003388 [Pleurodeles waltl]